MSASEAKDALEDCKRRMEWFKNFDPKSRRHISHLTKRIAALETRIRALKA
jgi:polyhydroxyalkanoate synthesis regulator phasin